MEQAAILSASETIGPDDLAIAKGSETSDLKVFIPEGRLNYKETLQELSEKAERRLIQRALEQTNNNKSKAAKLLGIGRRTLMYKLDKL